MWYTAQYAKTNIPTEETEAQTRPWLPAANEDGKRQAGFEAASPNRPETVDCLTGYSMLPRQNRITRIEIPVILRQGKRIRCTAIDLVTAPTKGDARFACIVPSGVDKRAAVRNRVKRVLRETVRLLLPNIRLPKDVVIIARTKLPNDVAKDRMIVWNALSKADML